MVNLTEGVDHVAASANNFYEGVSQAEVESFYAGFPETGHDPEWGLNSIVVRENGKLTEKVWHAGGMYGPAIEPIIYWLEKAVPLAENRSEEHTSELTSLMRRSYAVFCSKKKHR